jgi:hypothetical protein
MLLLGAGAFYLYQRSTIATAAARGATLPGTVIDTPGGSYVVDEQGRQYWLDAAGNVIYALDAAGHRVAVPAGINVNAEPSYYPPGSLQSVYL